MMCSPATGIQDHPSRNRHSAGGGRYAYLPPAGAPSDGPDALPPAGGDQPHNNLQPYLTFYFNIALQGVFPPRG